MANIKVRVGASIDSDMANAMAPLREAARRARREMAADQLAEEKQAANQSLKMARDRLREESKLNRDVFKAKAQAERDAMKNATQMAVEGRRQKTRIEVEGMRQAASEERRVRADAARQSAAEERQVRKQSNQQMLTDFEATVREMKREESRAQTNRVRRGMGLPTRGGGGDDGGLINYFGGRAIVNGVGRDFGRLSRGAMNVGRQVASGLGVDFDISSMVRRNVERERIATDISNSAFLPGIEGPNGQRQDPRAIQNEMRDLGAEVRIDPTKGLEGLQKFTEVSGDLKTGRDVIKELAFLSQASGSQLNHMAEAAGNVNAQLGDMPNKGAIITSVMRTVAGQGQLGAVEIKDMAKQMAALAAGASSFAGRPEDTIKMMGILAQEARQKGGAKSASMAAFSVSSLVNTFSKEPRAKAMAANKIDVFDKNHLINDLQGIITQMLIKTGGDPIKMSAMVKDMQAVRAVKGFQNIFNQTKGSQPEKVAAVTKEFDRLKREMEPEQIKESARRAMETKEAKAQAFQNRLDQIAEVMADRLMPQLEKMAPSILKVSEAFAKMVEYVATNPMKAIMEALMLSVSKAAIGEAIARSFGMSMGGGGAGGGGIGAIGGAGAGGIIGFTGKIVGLGMATAAAAEAISLAVEQWQLLRKEMNVPLSFAPGTSDAEKKRLLAMTPEEKQAEVAANINRGAIGPRPGRMLSPGPEAAGPVGVYSPEVLDAIDKAVDAKELLKLTADQKRLLQGTLKVEIVNLKDIQNAAPPKPEGNFFNTPPPDLGPGGVTRNFSPGGRQF